MILLNKCGNCGSDSSMCRTDTVNGWGHEIKSRYYIKCKNCSRKSEETKCEFNAMINWNDNNIPIMNNQEIINQIVKLEGEIQSLKNKLKNG